MTFQDLMSRVNEGEVVPVSDINGYPADQFISRNWQSFQGLTLENDIEKADCMWIYNKQIREKQEYNP